MGPEGLFFAGTHESSMEGDRTGSLRDHRSCALARSPSSTPARIRFTTVRLSRVETTGANQPSRSDSGPPSPIQKSERAKDDGAIALAQRAVITPRGTDSRPDDASELDENQQQDHEAYAQQTEGRDEGEGRKERCIRDDVADFVQVAAKPAFLIEFAPACRPWH